MAGRKPKPTAMKKLEGSKRLISEFMNFSRTTMIKKNRLFFNYFVKLLTRKIQVV